MAEADGQDDLESNTTFMKRRISAHLRCRRVIAVTARPAGPRLWALVGCSSLRRRFDVQLPVCRDILSRALWALVGKYNLRACRIRASSGQQAISGSKIFQIFLNFV